MYKAALAMTQKKGPSVEAFELLKAASKAGSEEASYALGSWYIYGEVVRKNFRKAAFYFSKARKVADAVYGLATCYELGKGRKKNLKKAFLLYKRSAGMGDGDSRAAVGRMLYFGIGTSANKKLAVKYLPESAKW